MVSYWEKSDIPQVNIMIPRYSEIVYNMTGKRPHLIVGIYMLDDSNMSYSTVDSYTYDILLEYRDYIVMKPTDSGRINLLLGIRDALQKGDEYKIGHYISTFSEDDRILYLTKIIATCVRKYPNLYWDWFAFVDNPHITLEDIRRWGWMYTRYKPEPSAKEPNQSDSSGSMSNKSILRKISTLPQLLAHIGNGDGTFDLDYVKQTDALLWKSQCIMESVELCPEIVKWIIDIHSNVPNILLFRALSLNRSLTTSIIDEYPDAPWAWVNVMKHKGIDPDYIASHYNVPKSYILLSPNINWVLIRKYSITTTSCTPNMLKYIHKNHISWSPDIHKYYPDSEKLIIRSIILSIRKEYSWIPYDVIYSVLSLAF